MYLRGVQQSKAKTIVNITNTKKQKGWNVPVERLAFD